MIKNSREKWDSKSAKETNTGVLQEEKENETIILKWAITNQNPAFKSQVVTTRNLDF